MKYWLMALLLAIIVAIAFVSSERNRAPFSDSEGAIWKGQKFGITIGQPDAINKTGLHAQGWSYDHTEMGGSCIRHHYSNDFTLAIFVDESWRHGTLCVISKEHRVRAIEWFFGPFWSEL